MDDGIIIITISTTGDEWKMYWHNLNKYPTRKIIIIITTITTTTKDSNICGGGGNDGKSTSSSVITYLFFRCYYEKPYLVYVC